MHRASYAYCQNGRRPPVLRWPCRCTASRFGAILPQLGVLEAVFVPLCASSFSCSCARGHSVWEAFLVLFGGLRVRDFSRCWEKGAIGHSSQGSTLLCLNVEKLSPTCGSTPKSVCIHACFESTSKSRKLLCQVFQVAINNAKINKLTGCETPLSKWFVPPIDAKYSNP